ncbi:MAG: hypothetical protein V4805_16285 [Pseudomonadota bacterium]
MPSFTLPSPAAIFALILFGTIGLAAFVYGKKTAQFKTIFIGIGLMVYPYFVSQAWLLYGIGVALCVGLYFFRD